jgi:hypothetical protein
MCDCGILRKQHALEYKLPDLAREARERENIEALSEQKVVAL